MSNNIILSEYDSLKKNITNVYSSLLKEYNYVNRSKLIILMDFWLDLYFFADKNHLELRENRLDLVDEIFSRYFYKANKKNIEENLNPKVLSNIKSLLKSLIHYFPLPYGILLGGIRKKWEKYFYRITLQKLKKLKWSINNRLKTEFLNNIKGNIDSSKFNILKETLSDKFFLNPIKVKNFPSTFYGASDNLFKEEFCYLLFVDQKLKFIGIQHGGQYGELKECRFIDFEYLISDDFYHWGLGAKNIKQNRFNNNQKPFNKIKQIFLVEASEINELLNNFFLGFKEMNEELKVHNENFNYSNLLTGIISHPRSKNSLYPYFINKKLFNELNDNEIQSTLYIINFPTQTFMYKAIYENLPFLMFINREWEKWFTPNYSKFLEFSNKHKYLFYWDEEEEFYIYLNQIINNGKMINTNNQVLVDYLEGKN